MEVTSISITMLTQAYLDRIRRLNSHNPEELSEFLQLGCRLIHIKSLALLPQAGSDEQAEELNQLNIELEEYRHYQLAAATLARNSQHRTWQRQSVTKLDVSELPMPNIELGKLQEAFARAVRRAEPISPRGNIPAHLSQAEVTKRITDRLKSGSFELETLLIETKLRIAIIVTFLALLELIKSHAVRVVQQTQFDPIVIEAVNA